MVEAALSSFSSPMPGRSTLPRPSGQPSPSSSSVATYFIALTLAGYRSLRNFLSPVQRQTNATAEGYFDDSSVLPGSGLAPKYTAPSCVTSCTILPLPLLTICDTSRSARRWSLIGPNWPAATAAKAVYSPSVPKSQEQ